MLNVTVDAVIYQLQARGGISRLYSELLPRLCDQEPELHIDLLSAKNLVQPLPRHAQISPHIVSSLSGARLPRPLRAAINGVLRQQAIGIGTGRIWHSTYFTRPRLWKGAQVVTIYDMIQELYPNLFAGPEEEAFRALKRRCALDADIVISISDVTRQDVHRLYGIDPAKIVTIPLACSDVFHEQPDDGLPSGTPRLTSDKPFFLYVGRRSHNKNFTALARAYSVWQGRKEVDLAVVGEPWSADEQALFASLGIVKNLHLIGSVGDLELRRLYRAASAYVYPSLYEGFGIPLLEAMSCGCPVIASRIPSTVEIAGDRPTYFEVDAPNSLISALEAAKSEGRNTAHTSEAKEHAQRYSWAATARQTLDVYRKLAASMETAR